ncbi:helix-hairpin-helix domain-containing protein [Salinarimonas soli]|uniref:Helix-hairpin-helix domain-containing protein n=2 Tax=Salinarimonas soli TaxID=1638099 RepID=A0A5B2VJG0_9HYPH|nr:helix-hairpin-helix domain-containing protein [Salinarimonas soli]
MLARRASPAPVETAQATPQAPPPAAAPLPLPAVNAEAPRPPVVLASAGPDIVVPLPKDEPLPPAALAFAGAEPKAVVPEAKQPKRAAVEAPETTGTVTPEKAPVRTKLAARTEPEEAPRKAAAKGVDLNKGSLDELNSLRGAGLIGRAIVRKRPYASTEDLVRKRVVNRSTYERIKGQIVVR